MTTCVAADGPGADAQLPEGDELFNGLARLASRHLGVATVLIVEERFGLPQVRSCCGASCSLLPSAVSTAQWAACPIMAADGVRLGEIVLLDEVRAAPDAQEWQLLEDLARLAASAMARDSARVALEREVDQLRESEQRMALAITNSATGVWDRNAVTGEIHYSAGWKALLGYAEDELTSSITDSYERLHPEDRDYVKATIQAHFDQLTPGYEVEHRIRCKDGSYKWICSRGKVVSRDANSKPLRMIGTTTDITERKRLEAELHALATIDFLTQLPNRRHFMHVLDTEFARFQRGDVRSAVVLMCDLDHFKAINDQWGHGTGDLALKYFADLLVARLRPVDVAGRIGGEEFAVILRDMTVAQGREFGARLQTSLATTPLLHAQDQIVLTLSVGLSAFLATDTGADAALGRSDQALYRAKVGGRNRVEE